MLLNLFPPFVSRCAMQPVRQKYPRIDESRSTVFIRSKLEKSCSARPPLKSPLPPPPPTPHPCRHEAVKKWPTFFFQYLRSKITYTVTQYRLYLVIKCNSILTFRHFSCFLLIVGLGKKIYIFLTIFLVFNCFI